VARFTGFCCSARCPRAWRVGSLSSSKGQNNLSLMLKRGIGVLVGAALVVALLAVLPAVDQAQEGRTPIQEAPVANRGADRGSTPTAGVSGRRDRKAPEAAVERKTLPDEVAVAAVPVVRSLAADSSRRSLLATLSGARAMVLLAASGLVESIVTDDQYSARKLLGWVITVASLGIGAFPLVLAIIRAARRKSRYRPVYGGRAYATPIARSRHRRLLRTRNRGAGRPPRDPTVSGAWQSQVREGASTER
jgi:hypothetical protein